MNENEIYKKNIPDLFSNNEILKYLDEFIYLYKKRPIKNNIGGMRFPHMFSFYYLLKILKPEFIVESGVYKGQSTWLIENTLPKSKVLSIDLNLKQREYVSKSSLVEYSNIDFVNQDFSNLPKNSLVFFDDHQNFYERLIFSYFFGFAHIVHEDNYPILHGDTYSFKKIYAGTGLNDSRITLKAYLKNILFLTKYFLKKKINKNYRKVINKYSLFIQDVDNTENHFKNIKEKIQIYFECPPIFKNKLTRWGDLWTDKYYATRQPLLDASNSNVERYKDIYIESDTYTWISYIKFK